MRRGINSPQPGKEARGLSLSSAALIRIALGTPYLVAVRPIASSIDHDGFLHEPFPLLPSGWLFIALGVVALVVSIVRPRIR